MKNRQLKYKQIEYSQELPTPYKVQNDLGYETYFFTYAKPPRKHKVRWGWENDMLHWIYKHNLQEACLTNASNLTYNYLLDLSVERRDSGTAYEYAENYMRENFYEAGTLSVPYIGGRSYKIAVLEMQNLPLYLKKTGISNVLNANDSCVGRGLAGDNLLKAPASLRPKTYTFDFLTFLKGWFA